MAASDRALALDPSYSFAWNNRSAALANLGRYNEALTACEQAIALDSNNDAAWNNKGTALVSLKCYEEALVAYDQALALDPNARCMSGITKAI